LPNGARGRRWRESSKTGRLAHKPRRRQRTCSYGLASRSGISASRRCRLRLLQKRLIERHILHVGQEIAASDLLAYPVDCAIGKRYSPDDAPRQTTDGLLANVCDCFSRGRLARESLCECLPDDISRRPVRELGNPTVRGVYLNGHYQASPVSMLMS